MIVEVVAETAFSWEQLKDLAGYVPHYDIGAPKTMLEEAGEYNGEKTYRFTDEYDQWAGSLPKEHDELAEAAGRLCYKSWNRPNPATATNDGYLANIISQGHFSVLEHASATLYVSGVSRNLLTELERHRYFSLSVVSQRYVDHSAADWVVPPAVEALPEPAKTLLASEMRDHQMASEMLYQYIMQELAELGVTGKKAKEAARAVLPGATETEFLMTGNHRAYREFLEKRMSPAADAEMYQFARAVYAVVSRVAPNTYQDISDPEGAAL